ncbi:MAG: glutamate 5-kinase [Myxococcales bacterium]|nr:glutamate 5-kinase [Myxococcota bacterium]MDW8281378.1 glutamate 5-kinase [Myxococcales bacterium]
MRETLRGARRVLVKIGSRLLAEEPAMVERLCDDVAAVRAQGIEVLIVTSGAIALGLSRLGWRTRPRDLPRLQAAAAVGQGQLMQRYDAALRRHGLVPAQVLLTHDDVRHRGRYLAARHALLCLLEAGAVPVINENDTVSTAEIKFGDNDLLAALCTSLIEADLLVILTDVDGLHAGDPRTGAPLLPLVREADQDLERAAGMAGGAGSALGTGGMASKVQAARIAARFGVPTVVCSGLTERPLATVLDGQERGTLFLPRQDRLQSRKHWIAYALRPQGYLFVDEGARRAVVEAGKSLLPSGIVRVEGDFEAGEAVAICDEGGVEFARGLCAYEAAAVRLIAGRHTSEVESILGYKDTDEVIHRNDLVLL